MNGFILSFECRGGQVTCFFPTERRVKWAARFWATQEAEQVSEMAIWPGTQEDVNA